MTYQKVDFKVDSMPDKTIWINKRYINFKVWKNLEIYFLAIDKKTNVWYKIKENIDFVSLWKILKYYDINRIINITYSNKKGEL